MFQRIVTRLAKGVIPALDVSSIAEAAFIIRHTRMYDGIVGYKVGKSLGLWNGLPKVIEKLSRLTDKPLIYDDQKSPGDIPAQAREFVQLLSESNVDFAIGFPHSGPAVMEAFLDECRKLEIEPIIGLHMTHDKFTVSEGGWIADKGPKQAFKLAVEMGVTNFVVPGSKPEHVAGYYKFLTGKCKLNPKDLRLFAPGFIAQGGSITKCGQVAGQNWCAIVGTAITKHIGDWRAMRKESQALVSQINA